MARTPKDDDADEPTTAEPDQTGGADAAADETARTGGGAAAERRAAGEEPAEAARRTSSRAGGAARGAAAAETLPDASPSRSRTAEAPGAAARSPRPSRQPRRGRRGAAEHAAPRRSSPGPAAAAPAGPRARPPAARRPPTPPPGAVGTVGEPPETGAVEPGTAGRASRRPVEHVPVKKRGRASGESRSARLEPGAGVGPEEEHHGGDRQQTARSRLTHQSARAAGEPRPKTRRARRARPAPCRRCAPSWRPCR